MTLACGTGSTASAFVGWKTGQLKERVIVRTRGGILEIEVRKTEKGGETLMKGPAKLVFGGSILWFLWNNKCYTMFSIKNFLHQKICCFLSHINRTLKSLRLDYSNDLIAFNKIKYL